MRKLIKYNGECKKETDISDALVGSIATGKFPDEPIVAKHLLCIGKKAGYQDSEGKLQIEYGKKILTGIVGDPQKAEEIASICLKPSDTPEKTAFAVSKCLRDHTKLV